MDVSEPSASRPGFVLAANRCASLTNSGAVGSAGGASKAASGAETVRTRPDGNLKRQRTSEDKRRKRIKQGVEDLSYFVQRLSGDFGTHRVPQASVIFMACTILSVVEKNEQGEMYIPEGHLPPPLPGKSQPSSYLAPSSSTAGAVAAGAGGEALAGPGRSSSAELPVCSSSLGSSSLGTSSGFTACPPTLQAPLLPLPPPLPSRPSTPLLQVPHCPSLDSRSEQLSLLIRTYLEQFLQTPNPMAVLDGAKQTVLQSNQPFCDLFPQLHPLVRPDGWALRVWPGCHALERAHAAPTQPMNQLDLEGRRFWSTLLQISFKPLGIEGKVFFWYIQPVLSP